MAETCRRPFLCGALFSGESDFYYFFFLRGGSGKRCRRKTALKRVKTEFRRCFRHFDGDAFLWLVQSFGRNFGLSLFFCFLFVPWRDVFLSGHVLGATHQLDFTRAIITR